MDDPRHVRRIRLFGAKEVGQAMQGWIAVQKGRCCDRVLRTDSVTYHLIHTKGQDFLSRSSLLHCCKTRSVRRYYIQPLVKLKVVPYFIFWDFFNGPVTFCVQRTAEETFLPATDINVADQDDELPFSWLCSVLVLEWMRYEWRKEQGLHFRSGNLLIVSHSLFNPQKYPHGGKWDQHDGDLCLEKTRNHTWSNPEDRSLISNDRYGVNNNNGYQKLSIQSMGLF